MDLHAARKFRPNGARGVGVLRDRLEGLHGAAVGVPDRLQRAPIHLPVPRVVEGGAGQLRKHGGADF